jgi:hypothetical protein
MTAHDIRQQLEILVLWAIRHEERNLLQMPALETAYFDGAAFTPALQKATKTLYSKHKVAAWWKQWVSSRPVYTAAQARRDHSSV